MMTPLSAWNVGGARFVFNVFEVELLDVVVHINSL
jgi:hypothetical protein